MGKNLKMLRLDAIMQKVHNLTKGKDYPTLYGVLLRSDNTVIQEFHNLLNNFSDQITVLKQKLKSEQEKIF
jgi:hypothetical protein